MLGHYSGPWAIRAKASELGLAIAEDRVADVLAGVRALIRERKRPIRDGEFAAIVEGAGR